MVHIKKKRLKLKLNKKKVSIKQNVHVNVNVGGANANKNKARTKPKPTYNNNNNNIYPRLTSLGVVPTTTTTPQFNVQQGYRDDEYKKAIENKLALVESRQERQQQILDDPKRVYQIVDDVDMGKAEIEEQPPVPPDKKEGEDIVYGDASKVKVLHERASIVAGKILKSEFKDIMDNLIASHKVYAQSPKPREINVLIALLKENNALSGHLDKSIASKIKAYYEGRGK